MHTWPSPHLGSGHTLIHLLWGCAGVRSRVVVLFLAAHMTYMRVSRVSTSKSAFKVKVLPGANGLRRGVDFVEEVESLSCPRRAVRSRYRSNDNEQFRGLIELLRTIQLKVKSSLYRLLLPQVGKINKVWRVAVSDSESVVML